MAAFLYAMFLLAVFAIYHNLSTHFWQLQATTSISKIHSYALRTVQYQTGSQKYILWNLKATSMPTQK